jgi:hypothetical protein
MRKNTLLIFTAFLLVGGSFVFAEYRNKQAKSIYSSEKIQQGLAVSAIDEINSSAKDIDIDGDGSKDWEEILVGSNPNDPKSKPDQTKAGVTGDITKSTPEKLEPIDVVSRDFFARYMELRQIGAVKDKTSQDELVARTIGNMKVSNPAEYTVSDISITPDESKESLVSYGKEVGNIFRKFTISSRNEAVIVKESMEKENPEILKEIDPIISSYKSILNALVKVSVPKSMSSLHLDLVNSMNGSLFIAQSFRDSGNDAIKGIQAISHFSNIQVKLFNSITSINSYYKNIGIYEKIF